MKWLPGSPALFSTASKTTVKEPWPQSKKMFLSQGLLQLQVKGWGSWLRGLRMTLPAAAAVHWCSCRRRARRWLCIVASCSLCTAPAQHLTTLQAPIGCTAVQCIDLRHKIVGSMLQKARNWLLLLQEGGMLEALHGVEMPLVPLLAAMESQGMVLDRQTMKQAA